MTGFFGKLFGGKKESGGAEGLEAIIENAIGGVLEKGNFDLQFDIKDQGASADGVRDIYVELFGDDQDLLTEKDGALLDAFQLFLKRVLQHQAADERINLIVDCEGYREEANKGLVELAEKLKGIALEKGKSVYFRALPPKDRKVIHQYLAADGRVKSRSIGDGLYKKIKIFPVKEGDSATHESDNL